MTAQLAPTDSVYWPGNSPRCRCCWCCFFAGCNYERRWFDALIWTTSISLLIGHRTVWAGHSSRERPCNVLINAASALPFDRAHCTCIDKWRPVNFFSCGQNINQNNTPPIFICWFITRMALKWAWFFLKILLFPENWAKVFYLTMWKKVRKKS